MRRKASTTTICTGVLRFKRAADTVRTVTQAASFRVDPRLTAILGESYSSSERALRELIDNAWDAEATEVHVTLPDILSDAPIIVADNGSGMKEKELSATT